jgi:hypothetical protein
MTIPVQIQIDNVASTDAVITERIRYITERLRYRTKQVKRIEGRVHGGVLRAN